MAPLIFGRLPIFGRQCGTINGWLLAKAVKQHSADSCSILGLAAWVAVSKWGLAGLNNTGPHGLSEIIYAYSSETGNNGSAFAGLTANTPWRFKKK